MTVPFTIWCTGLPSSGHTQLAAELTQTLSDAGRATALIDSSAHRRTPEGAALGFSPEEREVQMLRMSSAARALMSKNQIAVVSAVSPYKSVRTQIRRDLGQFVEVHVATPAAACIDKDKTGNWANALAGKLRGFTGIDAPYEAPEAPEVRVDLSMCTISDAVDEVLRFLKTTDFT